MNDYQKSALKGLIFYVAYHLWMEARWRQGRPIYWWMRHPIVFLGTGFLMLSIWIAGGVGDWSTMTWQAGAVLGLVAIYGVWRYRVADRRWRGVYVPPPELATEGVNDSSHVTPFDAATYDADRLPQPPSPHPHPNYRLPPRYRRVSPGEVEFECLGCHNPQTLVKFTYEQDEWGWLIHATHDLCGVDEWAREDDEPFAGY
jgi:hypothetical protein